MLLGVDTGGTFTDFVLFDGESLRVHKVLSTPEAPERAILQGVRELGIEGELLGELKMVHGSTVATNAALEGKGVRTVFITNRGLKDLLTLGRQARRELYNLQPAPIAPPVPAELCLETGGRLGADGTLVEPLTEADLKRLRDELERLRPEAVAINLLFSFLDARFEREIEAIVPEGVFISRSSAILPEYKEYERGITTWLNAWVGPLVEGYLARLEAGLPGATVSVMQSSGNTIEAGLAGRQAVHMLLSGPAGGLSAARAVGALAGVGADGRYAHHRRRRRLHRPGRCGWLAAGGARIGRGGSRAGLLRQGRQRAHRDRRQPGARPPAARGLSWRRHAP